MLGGTEFLGIHLVEGLVSAGWDVTLFNRGVTGPDLFDSLVHLKGDRDSDVSALAGRDWDVVYDLSAFHPDQVARTAEHLSDHCAHYIFVSSISAYADFRQRGTTETAPLGTFDGPVPTEVDGASYGPLKALCEEQVRELFSDFTIIRPAVVVGPLDPSDRFTYWVLRLSEPGFHVLPPDLDAALQYVDVRDLADWMAQLGDQRTKGVFNAAADAVSFGRFVEVIAQVAGVALQPVSLTVEEMVAEEVRPWFDLPMWLPPEDLDMRGFFAVDSTQAVAAGLWNRPLEATVEDTLAWARANREKDLRIGLAAEREAELVTRHGTAR